MYTHHHTLSQKIRSTDHDGGKKKEGGKRGEVRCGGKRSIFEISPAGEADEFDLRQMHDSSLIRLGELVAVVVNAIPIRDTEAL